MPGYLQGIIIPGTMGNHCLLVFRGELNHHSGFFRGARFCPSTVGSPLVLTRCGPIGGLPVLVRSGDVHARERKKLRYACLEASKEPAPEMAETPHGIARTPFIASLPGCSAKLVSGSPTH